ncbi:AraC family transcriptional regulator [Vallitalea longa]|uniref:AraC family transcriptional regulator n=1 Tax=Vallitalea longa TaxID=2936439 RepID=A0A9W5YFB1_9FIRM|nr:AraC family transcriptional regulator [Vallitalea longa]GKX31460.1 AraC family transcriptional regulator [Vallitalea longa]
MQNNSDAMQKKIIKISISDINPYIRRASKHIIEAGFYTGIRINPHYQLHYICKGKGMFIIGNQSYNVTEGDFLIWGPGQLHSIKSDVLMPLLVIGVQFDMTRNHCHLDYPCIHYNEKSFSWNKVNEVVEFNDLNKLSSYSQVKDRVRIKYYLEEVQRLYCLRSTYCQGVISGLLKAALTLVIENNLYNLTYNIGSKISVETIINYLKTHSDEKMTNSFLGQRFNYHPNHLNKLVLNCTGQTIQQYLITLRMNKAVDLLQHSNNTIGEIAEEVGGYSIHYFSRLFKKKIGVSPKVFRG